MSGQGKLLVKTISWLRAVDDRIASDRQALYGARLIDVDARTAIQISRFLIDEDLSFFLSKPELAKRLGCAKSTAESSLNRLEAAGFLRAAAPPPRLQSKRRGSGRSAKCFSIVPVSPDQSGETMPRKTPERSGEKPSISPDPPGETRKAISPGRSGGVSPDWSGPIREEEKEESRRGEFWLPASEFGSDFDHDFSIDEGGHQARPSVRAAP